MKKLLTIVTTVIALNAGAQSDSTQKKDTVYVPLYDVKDTVKATIVYMGEKGLVMHTKGFVIVKGKKYADDRKARWKEQPAVDAIVDERYKKVSNVLQVL